MKGKILKFISIALQVFLLGGFLSFLFLIYLVVSDSYFQKLDFQDNGIHEKIKKYFLFRIYIPIVLLLLFSILLTIKEKIDKIITAISGLLGIVMFIALDQSIKKFLIVFPDYILLSLIVFCLINGLLFLVFFFQLRKLIN
jgi:hypothetical protein